MDGKGRYLDNIYIERFWRSIKYEDFYLNDYQTVPELRAGIKKYIEFYNNRRWHQSLKYKTPASVYYEKQAVDLPYEIYGPNNNNFNNVLFENNCRIVS